MADLLAQFAGRPGSSGEAAPEHDPEARFLRAVQDLREMAGPPPRLASPEIYR